MLCIFAAKTANPEGNAFIKGSIVAIVVICLGKLLVYLLPSGLIFSQRVALCLMMWIVMLGSSMAAYTRRHIFLQAAQKLVPEDLMKYHMAMSLIFAAIFTIFLWYTSSVYALHDWEIYAKSGIMKAGVFETIPIPYWAVTVAVPIGFGLTLLRFLGTAISVLKGDVSALPEEGMIVMSDNHPELDEEESP
jgi:TRAP-type C4-dicarboxylate transport system permease small subunit